LDGTPFEINEENPEFGVVPREELNAEGIDGDLETTNRRMKKRSSYNHWVRCYFRLRTKCCKDYSITNLIGYKL